jgi:hypothetical protein
VWVSYLQDTMIKILKLYCHRFHLNWLNPQSLVMFQVRNYTSIFHCMVIKINPHIIFHNILWRADSSSCPQLLIHHYTQLRAAVPSLTHTSSDVRLKNKDVMTFTFWLSFFSFLGWGDTESTWYVAHKLAYCTSPGWYMMNVEKSVEWELAGETEVFGENLLQCHFVHHKSQI